MGYKAEVLVSGKWSQNAEVWPDQASANSAGCDLLHRWLVPTDYRVVKVDDKPNRPSWKEWIRKNGLPKRHVSV